MTEDEQQAPEEQPEEQAEPAAKPVPADRAKFDPQSKLIDLPVRGQQGKTVPYLEARWRLVWLRSEHPEALIETWRDAENEHRVIFKAQVTIPGRMGRGGVLLSRDVVATGWAQAPTREDRYVEKAETRALSRALGHLGYGTEFSDLVETDEDGAEPPPGRKRGNPPAAPSVPERTREPNGTGPKAEAPSAASTRPETAYTGPIAWDEDLNVERPERLRELVADFPSPSNVGQFITAALERWNFKGRTELEAAMLGFYDPEQRPPTVPWRALDGEHMAMFWALLTLREVALLTLREVTREREERNS